VKEIYTELLRENGIEESKIIGIGFGFHGIVNFSSGILLTSPHNPVWGENINLVEKVRKAFPGIPVYVDNKIRFQAYAELIQGNWGTSKDIIVMDAGAGAISGVIMQNSLRRGHHSLAGHIGHMVVNPLDEEICKCGGRGCFEVLISTRRLLKKVREGYSEHGDSTLFSNTSESHATESLDTLTEQDVFAAADKGDSFARELLDEVIRWFALGLHNIALMYDPDIIIFQGKYGKGGDYFLSEIRKRVTEISLLKVKQPLQIEYSKISEHPGALGAAAYVVSEFAK
jgi:predicted NBD/HSP70 family sugar kinase